MLALEISPEADSDLLDIWLFIADDQPVNADRFLEKLLKTARRLAEFPHLGRDRPELNQAIKSFPVDRYNLYYTINKTTLIVVRVLPASRDIEAVFFEEP